MTVVTLLISENKKKLVLRHCVTESASIKHKVRRATLSYYTTQSHYKRATSKKQDMRYPLKWGTTKKDMLNINDL